jgi:hypothetical protein
VLKVAAEALLLRWMSTMITSTQPVRVRLVRDVLERPPTRTGTSGETPTLVGTKSWPVLSAGDSLTVTFSEEFTLV